MVRLMVFDHDMTIVDSSYAIMAGFNYVAEHEGLPPVSHELTMKHIADPIPAFCEGLLGEYRPEWVRLYRERIAGFERELIRPYPDTIPVMNALRNMGIKTAVLSNRERPSSVLKNTGLDVLFDAIVGALEPFGKMPYKPAPDMMNALMSHMDVKPDETVYIGDSDLDIMTAIGAHVRGIGITKGIFTRDDFVALGAWRVIDTLSELIAITENENAAD
ncbi:MAG: HAD-IA family hydrolase [Synergistaceae bacterium]|nr:HAD-IA family hydrolase [Synergistaceae bacterium]